MPTPREQRVDALREGAFRDEKPDGLSAVQVANRWAQLFASSDPDCRATVVYMTQPAGERVLCVDAGRGGDQGLHAAVGRVSEVVPRRERGEDRNQGPQSVRHVHERRGGGTRRPPAADSG